MPLGKPCGRFPDGNSDIISLHTVLVTLPPRPLCLLQVTSVCPARVWPPPGPMALFDSSSGAVLEIGARSGPQLLPLTVAPVFRGGRAVAIHLYRDTSAQPEHRPVGQTPSRISCPPPSTRDPASGSPMAPGKVDLYAETKKVKRAGDGINQRTTKDDGGGEVGRQTAQWSQSGRDNRARERVG